ncbi:uncharacterized protein LOC133316315 [Gastrolobium bilobum]|uniref:uncharacterized protein LOC133316315 n=1 Tax=Gastrolobium bilobum TaxID=150636 RepID=UPI002AAFF53E|nr:uncharacterized protein LOC133316315 [Gastrolobium bilobum]
MSLFQSLYGKPPPSFPFYPRGLAPVDALDAALTERNDLLCSLKRSLLRAQQRMKLLADKHRVDRSFHVGDMVLLKLQPHRQVSVVRRSNHKLAKRFFGPFPVAEILSLVAYRLALPVGCKIHPTFHVSVLKRFYGADAPVSTELPTDSVDNRLV